MDNISATHSNLDQPNTTQLKSSGEVIQANHSLLNEHTYDDSSSFQSDALISDGLLSGWQQVFGNIKHGYIKAADSLVDEILITLSQKQVNDALYKFVTKNVKMLHNLKLDMHDNWLRLTCTVNIMGIFATVASNFQLVHLQLDRHTQRLVLRQISDTDIIELHTKQWYKAPAARIALGAYRLFLRKDPLPFILSSIKIKGIPFTEHKGNVIYLDIGRWLKSNEMIMTNLKKAQVNDGDLKPQQLLLKIQPNFGDILSFGDPNADIITEKDNPDKQDDQDN